MKNYLCLLVVVFLWCVFMPMIIHPADGGQAPSEESEISDGDDVTDIKVRYFDSGDETVKEIELEEYIARALAYLMDETAPLEALKAQAVAIRSVVCYRHENSEHAGYELCCEEEHCFKLSDAVGQRHKEAVTETKGEILSFDGKAALALSHCSSYEKTENYEYLSGDKLPYLVSVPVCDESRFEDYQTVLELSSAEFASAFSDYNTEFEGDYEEWVGEKQYTAGNRVYTINVGGLCFKGSTFARLFELDSLCFDVGVNESGFLIKSYGKGNGVGMSRCSAIVMAGEGEGYLDILEHFYPETKLLHIKANKQK